MAFFDDFTVDYSNKIIRHTSGTTIYSGVTMYSEIQDLWDALNQMDDTIPISAQTPTQFTLLNGWFMTAADLEYINSASIQTSGWGSNVIEAIAYDASGADAVSGDGVVVERGLALLVARDHLPVGVDRIGGGVAGDGTEAEGLQVDVIQQRIIVCRLRVSEGLQPIDEVV